MSRTIYYNGTILTMNPKQPVAKAVTVEDGRITSTAAAVAISQIRGYDAPASAADPSSGRVSPGSSAPHTSSRTRYVDLKGATMLPAFLDAHSHFSGYANSLLQVPLEEAAGFGEIVAQIRSYLSQNGVPAGVWVIGKGYDHNRLKEGSHPDRILLDEAAPDNPLVIQHQSGHMGVFNTAALQLLNITSDTPCPSGGRIEIRDGRPTGYLEENAFVSFLQKVPMPSVEDLMASYVRAQEKYASYGITTLQEGMLPLQLVPLYRTLMERNLLKLDVVGYADAKEAGAIMSALPDCRNVYRNHFKLGGMKIFLDGSPQGRTAWMRAPYSDSRDYCGYGTLTDEELERFLTLSVRENAQLLAHCNGDAAAAQFLRACQKAEDQGLPFKSLRPVLIHGQLLGADQLPAVRQLGVIPSFFVAHVYYWGDIHVQNFGFRRASRISPAASALAEGIPFTFHQDAPVIQPDMLETLWCSAVRLTKGGVKLDAEAIPVEEALKAVTIHAAYQYFEENEKGSIESDKRADFVILDKNPLDVDPMELRKIRVLETVKDGETVFER